MQHDNTNYVAKKDSLWSTTNAYQLIIIFCSPQISWNFSDLMSFERYFITQILADWDWKCRNKGLTNKSGHGSCQNYQCKNNSCVADICTGKTGHRIQLHARVQLENISKYKVEQLETNMNLWTIIHPVWQPQNSICNENNTAVLSTMLRNNPN